MPDRAFGLSDALAHLQIARLTQIDYDREMLLGRMIGYCRTRGTESLRVRADPENEALRGLLDTLGFRDACLGDQQYCLSL